MVSSAHNMEQRGLMYTAAPYSPHTQHTRSQTNLGESHQRLQVLVHVCRCMQRHDRLSNHLVPLFLLVACEVHLEATEH